MSMLLCFTVCCSMFQCLHGRMGGIPCCWNYTNKKHPVAMGVLQCVGVCCSVCTGEWEAYLVVKTTQIRSTLLQCVCCSVLRCDAVSEQADGRHVLLLKLDKWKAPCCSECVAACCSVLQCIAVCCSVCTGGWAAYLLLKLHKFFTPPFERTTPMTRTNPKTSANLYI